MNLPLYFVKAPWVYLAQVSGLTKKQSQDPLGTKLDSLVAIMSGIIQLLFITVLVMSAAKSLIISGVELAVVVGLYLTFKKLSKK